MVRAGDAKVLEHRIGLRVLLGKRIGADAVVFEKLLRFHALASKPRETVTAGIQPSRRLFAQSYFRSRPSIIDKKALSWSVTVRSGP